MDEERKKPVWPWIVGALLAGAFTLVAACVLWIGIKAYRSTEIEVDENGNLHGKTTVD